MALLFLVTGLFATAAVASPASCCSKPQFKAILPLSDNCFAQQYCSKEFPVPAVTKTTATNFITSTAVATSTTTLSTTLVPTVIVYTTNTTTITSTVSTTSTASVTTTTTVTTTSVSTTGTSTTTVVTDARGNVRREAAFTPAAAAHLEARRPVRYAHVCPDQVSRVQAKEAQYVAYTKSNTIRSALSTACSCIQTPVTVLVNATSTTTLTSTSTVNTTLSFTSPTTTTSALTNTETATATTELTTTTTLTATATATQITPVQAIVTRNVCGQDITPPSGAPLRVICGSKAGGTGRQDLGSATAGSYYECLIRADNIFSSTAFAYQFSTGTCYIYAGGSDYSAATPDADFVFSYFRP